MVARGSVREGVWGCEWYDCDGILRSTSWCEKKGWPEKYSGDRIWFQWVTGKREREEGEEVGGVCVCLLMVK